MEADCDGPVDFNRLAFHPPWRLLLEFMRCGRRCAPGGRAVASQAAAGALEYLPVARVPSLNHALSAVWPPQLALIRETVSHAVTLFGQEAKSQVYS